jgi:hypothetical protein
LIGFFLDTTFGFALTCALAAAVLYFIFKRDAALQVFCRKIYAAIIGLFNRLPLSARVVSFYRARVSAITRNFQIFLSRSRRK